MMLPSLLLKGFPWTLWPGGGCGSLLAHLVPGLLRQLRDPAMALVWSWDTETLSRCSYHQCSRALCLQDAFVLAVPFLYR